MTRQKISAVKTPKSSGEPKYKESSYEDYEISARKELNDVKDEVKMVRLVSNTDPDELDQLWNDLAKPTNKVFMPSTKATSLPVYYQQTFPAPISSEEIPVKTLESIPYNYESENEEKDNVYGDSGLPEGDAIDKPYLVVSTKKSLPFQPTNNYGTYTLSGFRSLAPLVGKH